MPRQLAAGYLTMNERCQDYFMQNETRYEKIVEKLYMIGIYGNAEDYPDFLSFFARQYNFTNAGKHILGLERHKYDQKMKDLLLDEEDVKVILNEFISRCQAG